MALSTLPINSTTGARQSEMAMNNLSDDYTQFLTLLTAQIGNQDPLQPMDSSEFVSQLAQLSQVEQAVVTNNNLEGLAAQLATLSVVNGPNMLGRTVTVPSNIVELANGSVGTYFGLGQDAASVTAEIRDPTGFLVRTLPGLATSAGSEIPLGWDGTDDLGQPVLDGTYTVTIKATDVSGNPLPVYTYRDAAVEAVDFYNGSVFYLLSGDESVPANSIVSVQ